MKLIKAQITEFQSVTDSTEFEINDITCLVGKNEAGKTAILKALYRLNPIVSSDGNFDITEDYPRKEVEDYNIAIENGDKNHAKVVKATFELDEIEMTSIRAELGEESISTPELILTKGYGNTTSDFNFSLSINYESSLKYLVGNANLSSEDLSTLSKCKSAEEVLSELVEIEETSETKRLQELFTKIAKRDFNGYVFDEHLEYRIPTFLYFDEYYQMKGVDNIEKLTQRKNNNALEKSDHPLLGLIALARLTLDIFLQSQSTRDLKNKLEGAGNHLTKQIIKYWSQNKHIKMKFDVRPASSEDPEGLQTGNNIWADVYDSRHEVTTSVGNRSKGFIWFFSFLAWYSQVKKENVILLLDEPGLSLHAKAQEDLLRFFEEEIKDKHQLIYSTHSPFMVDPQHFERVRIVQDKGIDIDESLPPEEDGTKVFTDVFQANNDSLFPLQGALGYEIYQTLFVGPNNLVVEGTSDLLYMQSISSILQAKGRVGLSEKWTITPVGGGDKVPTFVALLGNQKGLKIATLIDIQNKDAQKIENLYKSRLLKKNNVLTFADFTKTNEADIEDMFDEDFYLNLVNFEYKNDLPKTITISDLKNKHPRILVRVEDFLKSNPFNNNISFSHYRPARYFVENSAKLAKNLSTNCLDRFEEAFKKLNALL